MARSLLLLALAAVAAQAATAPQKQVSHPAGETDGDQPAAPGPLVRSLSQISMTGSMQKLSAGLEGLPEDLVREAVKTNKEANFMAHAEVELQKELPLGSKIPMEQAHKYIRTWSKIQKGFEQKKNALQQATDVVAAVQAKLNDPQSGDVREFQEGETFEITLEGEEPRQIGKAEYLSYSQIQSRMTSDVAKLEKKINNLLDTRQGWNARMIENFPGELQEQVRQALDGFREFGQKVQEFFMHLKQKLTPGAKMQALREGIQNFSRSGKLRNFKKHENNPAPEPASVPVEEPASVEEPVADHTDSSVPSTNLGAGGVLDTTKDD